MQSVVAIQLLNLGVGGILAAQLEVARYAAIELLFHLDCSIVVCIILRQLHVVNINLVVHAIASIDADTHLAAVEQGEVGHVALREGILQHAVDVSLDHVALYLNHHMALHAPEVDGLVVGIARTTGMSLPGLVAVVQMIVGVDGSVIVVVGRNLPHVVAAALVQAEDEGDVATLDLHVGLNGVVQGHSVLKHIVGVVLHLAEVAAFGSQRALRLVPDGVVSPVAAHRLSRWRSP